MYRFLACHHLIILWYKEEICIFSSTTLFFIFRINPNKLFSIQPKLENICAADPHVKEMAQRVRIYITCVFFLYAFY